MRQTLLTEGLTSYLSRACGILKKKKKQRLLFLGIVKCITVLSERTKRRYLNFRSKPTIIAWERKSYEFLGMVSAWREVFLGRVRMKRYNGLTAPVPSMQAIAEHRRDHHRN